MEIKIVRKIAESSSDPFIEITFAKKINKFVARGIYKCLCLINYEKRFYFTWAFLFAGQQTIYANSHYVSHSKLQSPLTIQWYVYDVYHVTWLEPL